MDINSSRSTLAVHTGEVCVCVNSLPNVEEDVFGKKKKKIHLYLSLSIVDMMNIVVLVFFLKISKQVKHFWH